MSYADIVRMNPTDKTIIEIAMEKSGIYEEILNAAFNGLLDKEKEATSLGISPERYSGLKIQLETILDKTASNKEKLEDYMHLLDREKADALRKY